MKKILELALILLFPLLYIITDIFFRYQHIIYYSKSQQRFYLTSILLSLLIYIFTLILIRRNRSRPVFKYLTGIAASFYYTFVLLTSYAFKYSTGIFPNYYSLMYIRNEPSSTFSLFIDSIHLWHFLLFIPFLFSLFYYFMFISEKELIKKISLKLKLPVLILLILIPLIPLTINIDRCDQCMIVDSNFTVDLSRHLADWNRSNEFTGSGLPAKNSPVLNKTKKQPQFNILLIIFESLRAQNMQIYGYGRETTPFLCSLSRSNPDSLYVFEKNFTVSTTTMLAIPAILTGVTPEQPGVYFETFPFLWEYAGMINYKTFFISSQSMNWYRFDRYYSLGRPDYFWNRDNSGLPSFNDFGIDDSLTVEWLNRHIAKNAKRPFFGVMQFNTTHYPYKVPEKDIKWSGKYIDRYDNSVLRQDALLEKIFRNLSELGLLKNTVVIMTGDHGEAFKEHNSIGHIDTYNSETVSIPLIMYVPPRINSLINSLQLRANTAINTSNADITPTVINMLGVRDDKQVSRIYRNFTGKNLMAYIDRDRDIITLNSSEIMKFNSGVSLIKDNYHYILRTNIVPYRKELYNHKTDPMELNNIIKYAGEDFLKPMNQALAGNGNTLNILNLFYPSR